MITRSMSRCILCLLAAASATGCGSLRGFLSEPIVPPGPTNSNPIPAQNTGGASASESIPGGTVIAAGGTPVPQQPVQQAEGTQPPPAAPPGSPAPEWRSAAAPGGQPQPLPLPQPKHLHPAHPNAGAPPTAFADPHMRATPTAAGRAWELAPWEAPIDRLAELTAHLEAALVQNKALLARARELEAAGVAREQALVEAMREIESVTAAAAREKAGLLAQVAALEGRVRQLEEEDIEFLEVLLEALRKLAPPEKKP